MTDFWTASGKRKVCRRITRKSPHSAGPGLDSLWRRVLAIHSTHGNKHARKLLSISHVLILQPYIGVGASQYAKLFVILSPVGPYYPEGFNPVSLYAGDKYVRAWPGGTGDTKIGGFVRNCRCIADAVGTTAPPSCHKWRLPNWGIPRQVAFGGVSNGCRYCGCTVQITN